MLLPEKIGRSYLENINKILEEFLFGRTFVNPPNRQIKFPAILLAIPNIPGCCGCFHKLKATWLGNFCYESIWNVASMQHLRQSRVKNKDKVLLPECLKRQQKRIKYFDPELQNIFKYIANGRINSLFQPITLFCLMVQIEVLLVLFIHESVICLSQTKCMLKLIIWFTSKLPLLRLHFFFILFFILPSSY